MHGPAYASYTYFMVCDCGCNGQNKVDSKMESWEIQAFLNKFLNTGGKADVYERRSRWREFNEEVEWRLIPSAAQKAKLNARIEQLERDIKEFKESLSEREKNGFIGSELKNISSDVKGYKKRLK